MPTLQITNLRTMSQSNQNATLFNPFADALALTMDLTASADLIALPSSSLSAIFQIIDPRTNSVVVNRTWTTPFKWGRWFWISMGNNWGPPSDYQTPSRWGLSWGQNSVFGFRGIVKALYIPTRPPGSGWRAVDAFDVSDVRWFRLEEIFTL
jgi:hypothetical protein